MPVGLEGAGIFRSQAWMSPRFTGNDATEIRPPGACPRLPGQKNLSTHAKLTTNSAKLIPYI